VPDLSSASERVSEIVSTAMLSGMNDLVVPVDDIMRYRTEALDAKVLQAEIVPSL